MAKLNENPNAIYYNNKVISFYDTNSLAFSYYDGEMVVSSDTHLEMARYNDDYNDDYKDESLEYDVLNYEIYKNLDEMTPEEFAKDSGRGDYAGRVFIKEKILTFWHFPESKSKLKDVIDDINLFLKHRYAPGKLEINDTWLIEIPTEDVNDNKNWGDWTPDENSVKYIKIDEYEGGYKRTEEELKSEHQLPALKKSKKEVKNFGSEHPKYDDKVKWNRAKPFENLNISFNDNNLNESPDTMYYDENSYSYLDEDALAFGYLSMITVKDLIGNNIDYLQIIKQKSKIIIDGEEYVFFIGNNRKDWHSDLFKPASRSEYFLAGRLWYESEAISFWYKVPTKTQYLQLAKDVKTTKGINILEPTWKVEIYDEAGRPKVVKVSDFLLNTDEYYSKNKTVVPTEKDHELSPLLKKSKEVKGFGANHPKYQEKRFWERNKPFENLNISFNDNNLNESPDKMYSENGEEYMHWNYDALAFGYLNTTIAEDLIKQNENYDAYHYLQIIEKSTKVNIDGVEYVFFIGNTRKDWHSDLFGPATRSDYFLSGRLWYESEAISFWYKVPTKTQYLQLAKDVEDNRGINILGPEWEVEVYDENGNSKAVKVSDFLLNTDEYYSKNKTVVPTEKDHELSPLLKKSKEVKGFGANHPKYQEKRFWERNKPFENKTENFYPRLFESPDKITGMDLDWTHSDSIGFGMYNIKNIKNSVTSAILSGDYTLTDDYYLGITYASTHGQMILPEVYAILSKDHEMYAIQHNKQEDSSFYKFYDKYSEEDFERWGISMKLDKVKLVPFDRPRLHNPYHIITNYEAFIKSHKAEAKDKVFTFENIYANTLFLDRSHYAYAGRLWKNSKIISFWVYPDRENFLIIAKHLKETLNIDLIKDNWKVEILTNDELSWYYTEPENIDFVYAKDYQSSEQRSEEDLKKGHELSPLLKKSKENRGFGSEHPKYQEKRFWERNKPFENKVENFYPRLFENPDGVYLKDGEKLRYYHDAHAFGYYCPLFSHGHWANETLNITDDFELGVSIKNETHGDIFVNCYAIREKHIPSYVEPSYISWNVKDTEYAISGQRVVERFRNITNAFKFFEAYPELKQYVYLIKGVKFILDREHYLYAGRIWPKNKIISFWTYPNKENFIKIAKDIKNSMKVDILSDGWRIEIVKNDSNNAPWYNGDADKKVVDLIPTKDYLGSGKWKEEDLKKGHELSPLLKKSREVKGFGANHPKYQEKRFWERNKPFENKTESFYPRLFESPDKILSKHLNYRSKDAYPIVFVPKNQSLKDSILAVGKLPGQTHYEGINHDIFWKGNNYQGRIWLNAKVISWWDEVPKTYLLEVCKLLSDYFKLDIFEFEMEVSDNKFIVIKDYLKSEIIASKPSQEEYEEHLKSPLLKKSKENKGFGSEHPKYQEKRFWERNKPFENKVENFYPRLFESPDRIGALGLHWSTGISFGMYNINKVNGKLVIAGKLINTDKTPDNKTTLTPDHRLAFGYNTHSDMYSNVYAVSDAVENNLKGNEYEYLIGPIYSIFQLSEDKKTEKRIDFKRPIYVIYDMEKFKENHQISTKAMKSDQSLTINVLEGLKLDMSEIRLSLRPKHLMYFYRDDYAYPGRLWKDSKIISFWVYPDRENFLIIAKHLKETLNIDLIKDNWKVEVLYSASNDHDSWYQNEKNIEFVYAKDYQSSEQRSEEELKQEHELSPLLKKSKEVKGFGANHPKYQEKRFWERNKPFENKTENFYPRLFEKTLKQQIKDAERNVNTNPSELQKETGNYKKGHININGFAITIENPKGSIRSGVDKNGKKWSVKMKNTYGYFKNTLGKDGDQIDVFIGNNPDSDKIFVVDQIKNDGTFDESKVMMGFDSEKEAKAAYMSNYSKGWKGFGNITETSLEEFKKWLYDGIKQTKKFSEYKQFESFSKLNESPDTILVDTPGFNGAYGAYNAVYDDYDAYAFGYVNDEFQIHYNGLHGMFGDRRKMKFPGRLWSEKKMISFWQYPNKEQFIQIAKEIKDLTGIDILENGWKIEVISNRKEPNDEMTFDEYVEACHSMHNNSKLIPTIEYVSSDDNNDIDKDHELSPLLKKSKENKGFGSEHPKYQEKRFWERNKPFENLETKEFYPRLLEYKNIGSLYHIIDMSKLLYILNNNQLVPYNFFKGISTTRNKMMNHYVGDKPTSIFKLELDSGMLSNNYKIESFREKFNSVEFNGNMSVKLFQEWEELIKTKKIKNIDKYVTKLIIIKSKVENLKNSSWFDSDGGFLDGGYTDNGKITIPEYFKRYIKNCKFPVYVQEGAVIKKDDEWIDSICNHHIKKINHGYIAYKTEYKKKENEMFNVAVEIPQDNFNQEIVNPVIGYDYENLHLFKNKSKLEDKYKNNKDIRIYDFEYEDKDIIKDTKEYVLVKSGHLTW